MLKHIPRSVHLPGSSEGEHHAEYDQLPVADLGPAGPRGHGQRVPGQTQGACKQDGLSLTALRGADVYRASGNHRPAFPPPASRWVGLDGSRAFLAGLPLSFSILITRLGYWPPLKWKAESLKYSHDSHNSWSVTLIARLSTRD